MGSESAERLIEKDGLYYKPVVDGIVHVNDIPFKAPPKIHTLIRVEGNNVYLVDMHGKSLRKLTRIKDGPHGTARARI